MKLDDLKILRPLLTVIVVLSGFYYTTQMRLEQLETNVARLEADIVELRDGNVELGKSISRLQKKTHNHSRGKTHK